MATEITLFSQPQPVPAYLQNSPVAKALSEQMEGGLAGQKINRLSLRNSKFRFNKQGVEIGVSTAPHLDVVVIAANPTVGRLFWIKGFDSDQTGQRPDCYSIDGVKPEADSPAVQSPICATCPQNAKGSAKNGKGKACAYKKRVVVVAPTAIDGDAYALDVGSMSMFGDDDAPQRLFNLRSYIEALKANGLIVPAVVTRLSFDDEESVPKLFFSPVRVLTEQEYRMVEARVADPAVRDMLDDVDLKSEEGKPVGQPQQIAAPAVQAAPVQQQAPDAPPAAFPAAAPAQPAPAAAAPAATPPRRGRRPAVAETPPAAAPAPQPAPVQAAGFGFGAPAQATPAPQAQAAPAAPAVGGFTVDLDKFDA